MIYVIILFALSAYSCSAQGVKTASSLLIHRDYIKTTLNSVAIAAVALVLSPQWQFFTGEIAVSILWIIVFIPVFADVLHLQLFKALKLFRRQLGILMGVLAIIHFLQYLSAEGSVAVWKLSFWFSANSITMMAVGFAALLVSTTLLITSNAFATSLLGRSWKRLHRLVYLLLPLIILHSGMAKHFNGRASDFGAEGADQGGPGIFGLFLGAAIPLSLLLLGKLLQWRKWKNAPRD